MQLMRLEVEEGFLDGLVLDFEDGLNVVIGGRGVGKTAVIELIRFCLGAPTIEEGLTADSTKHAAGVLQGGIVTLSMEHNGELRKFSRASGDPAPRTTTSVPMPLILSQREVESIARTPNGRLNLIDSFLNTGEDESKSAVARIRATSSELRSLLGEIDELDEELIQELDVSATLSELIKKRNALGIGADRARAELEKLAEVQSRTNAFSVEQQLVDRARSYLIRWQATLETIASFPEMAMHIDGMRANATVAQVVEAVESDRLKVLQARQATAEHIRLLESEALRLTIAREPLDDELRTWRQQLEAQQQGAGKLARDISLLEERASRLEHLRNLRTEKSDRLRQLHNVRIEALGSLERVRERRFVKRQGVALHLNNLLGPQVKVQVLHSTAVDQYELAVRDLLRGSSLKYNELASVMARALPPAELCDLVFSQDAKRFSQIVGVGEDRASRVLNVLRLSEIESAITAEVNDEVSLCLLDGLTYKHIDEMSIGQRCTVVLSIVFANKSVVLVVDQPEDHLDNEFIADTLLTAIRGRGGSAQTIIATHNANIPVLGGAKRVTHLDSNGRRGFVASSGALSEPRIVDAILGVMEGGKDAFGTRVRFYG